MNGPPVVILGAGGHGRVVLDTLEASGIPIQGFLDAGIPCGTLVNGYPVLGADELLESPSFLERFRFFVAVGQQETRRRLHERIAMLGGQGIIAVHPSAVVSRHARIGDGTLVAPQAVIGPNAQVGRFCIINTNATVDHDCHLADGVQLGPGVRLAGGVACGENAFLGIGAVVAPGHRIGSKAVVGANACVLADVPDGLTVAGCPAKPRP